MPLVLEKLAGGDGRSTGRSDELAAAFDVDDRKGDRPKGGRP